MLSKQRSEAQIRVLNQRLNDVVDVSDVQLTDINLKMGIVRRGQSWIVLQPNED